MTQVKLKFVMALALITVAGLLLTPLANADTFSFSAGNYSASNILNDGNVGTNYDTLNFLGNSGSFSLNSGESMLVAISSVTFTQGGSCYYATCPNSQTGDAIFALTVGGVTQNIVVPWLACVDVGSCAVSGLDALTLNASSPVTFNVGGSVLTVSTLQINPVGGSFTQDLQAQITNVPEPSSMILLGSGALGFLGVIRKKVLA
jgi:hypothetical protein